MVTTTRGWIHKTKKLTTCGHRQAAKTAKALNNIPGRPVIKEIITSTMLRDKETAEVIRQKFTDVTALSFTKTVQCPSNSLQKLFLENKSTVRNIVPKKTPWPPWPCMTVSKRSGREMCKLAPSLYQIFLTQGAAEWDTLQKSRGRS